jgi:hypothetical protein
LLAAKAAATPKTKTRKLARSTNTTHQSSRIQKLFANHTIATVIKSMFFVLATLARVLIPLKETAASTLAGDFLRLSPLTD